VRFAIQRQSGKQLNGKIHSMIFTQRDVKQRCLMNGSASEKRRDHRPGTRYVKQRLSVVDDGRGRDTLLGRSTEIEAETDLRERTEEVTAINEILRKSRLEMAQREKMVAIGQMATGIAHEIGNPLTSISSVAQYLVRKLEIQEQKEQLLVIQYHVSRISNILRRILTLSGRQRAIIWTDINSLIETRYH
jgi:nitrogen-specific signal transduction histidine kinase